MNPLTILAILVLLKVSYVHVTNPFYDDIQSDLAITNSNTSKIDIKIKDENNSTLNGIQKSMKPNRGKNIIEFLKSLNQKSPFRNEKSNSSKLISTKTKTTKITTKKGVSTDLTTKLATIHSCPHGCKHCKMGLCRLNKCKHCKHH